MFFFENPKYQEVVFITSTHAKELADRHTQILSFRTYDPYDYFFFRHDAFFYRGVLLEIIAFFIYSGGGEGVRIPFLKIQFFFLVGYA